MPETWSVDQLEMSGRMRTLLRKEGVTTLSKLVSFSENSLHLAGISGFGEKQREELYALRDRARELRRNAPMAGIVWQVDVLSETNGEEGPDDWGAELSLRERRSLAVWLAKGQIPSGEELENRETGKRRARELVSILRRRLQVRRLLEFPEDGENLPMDLFGPHDLHLRVSAKAGEARSILRSLADGDEVWYEQMQSLPPMLPLDLRVGIVISSQDAAVDEEAVESLVMFFRQLGLDLGPWSRKLGAAMLSFGCRSAREGAAWLMDTPCGRELLRVWLRRQMDERLLTVPGLSGALMGLCPEKELRQALREMGATIRDGVVETGIPSLSELPEDSIPPELMKYLTAGEEGPGKARLRQMAKALPDTWEKRLLPLLDGYALRGETLETVFPGMRGRYLRLLKKPRGADPSDMRMDTGLPDTLRERLLSCALPEKRFSGGIAVSLSRMGLLRFLLQSSREERIKTWELCIRLQQLRKQLGLEQEEGEDVDDVRSALVAGILPALYGMDDDCRYYDFEQDFSELLHSLHLFRYHDCEMGTSYFYRAHPDMMRRYGLENPAELHQVLRRVAPRTAVEFGQTELQGEMALGRNPLLRMGDVNRVRQVERVIACLAPCTRQDVLDFCDREYGLNATTVLGNFEAQYGQTDRPRGRHVSPLIQAEVHIKLCEVFTEALYTREQVLRLSEKNLGMSMGPADLVEIGYHAWPDFALRGDCGSLNEWISKSLREKDRFMLSTFPPEITATSEFWEELNALRRNGTLVESAPGVFENAREAHLPQRWANRVLRQAERQRGIFTASRVCMEAGMDPEQSGAYVRALLLLHQGLPVVSIGEECFFRWGGLKTADLLDRCMEDNPGLKRLAGRLQRRYGIRMEADALVCLMRRCGYVYQVQKDQFVPETVEVKGVSDAI